MNVMRVRWNPVNEERRVSVRFIPGSSQPPKAAEVAPAEPEEEEAQAKVVRATRRKGPRASTGSVGVK